MDTGMNPPPEEKKKVNPASPRMRSWFERYILLKPAPLKVTRREIAGENTEDSSQKESFYADMAARLTAGTVDLALILIFLTPLMNFISRAIHGEQGLDSLMASLGSDATFRDLFLLLAQQGFWPRWLMEQFLTVTLCGIPIIFCWWKWGGTPGKLLMGLKIEDYKTGRPLSLARLVLRYYSYFFSIAPLMLGYIVASFTKTKRCPHDRIAGSAVIYTKRKLKLRERLRSLTQLVKLLFRKITGNKNHGNQ
jgi:uncharacterized RDD family membrane protein YckC